MDKPGSQKTQQKDRVPVGKGIGPVVSSAHLADSSALPALSEMEFALTMSNHAFHRWIVRCMTASGLSELGSLDVLVLHTVNSRGKARKLADICLILNVEDTHTVTYSVRKLEAQKLVKSGKLGKEKTVTITDHGEEICLRYKEIREALFVEAVQALGLEDQELSKMAALLRALSGQYDQAARAAASM
ncbi:MAG: transcriptional regulator [Hyphomicrobiales bacterium]|nr:MAG: transcriptional regulator [Hyphomicrobiales bacterium]